MLAIALQVENDCTFLPASRIEPVSRVEAAQRANHRLFRISTRKIVFYLCEQNLHFTLLSTRSKNKRDVTRLCTLW